MIWLTWRQFRGQAIATAALLGVVLLALAATGPHLWNLYTSTGLDGCHSGCTSAAASFLSQAQSSSVLTEFRILLYVLYAVPALIGVFWGAPLIARELEAGTYRLAWNQSVSRSRWAVAKLGLVALWAMATAGVLTLMTALWGKPYSAAMAHGAVGGALGSAGRLSPVIFGATGIAPIGYAAFGFALGAAIGLLIRRTVPAMAVTLAVYTAVAAVWPILIRPRLLPLVTKTVPLLGGRSGPNALSEMNIQDPSGHMTVVGNYSRPGAWILSNKTITPSGHLFTGPAARACEAITSTQQSCTNWLASLHLRQLVSYQPASRYWPLQWEEAGLFLLFALVIIGLSAWWIRRRTS